MPTTPHFCLSVRFLDPLFHGRQDGGAPEWPPSPLRLFQSLVAASAMRHRGQDSEPAATPALGWLETQARPSIIAPRSATAQGYRLSVPNNAMDLVARAWCKGNYFGSGDSNPATHRTMKTVRPTRMLEGNAIHYLWQLDDYRSEQVRKHVHTLVSIAGDLVALGWGIDLVVGHGAIVSPEQVEALPGERWHPTEGTDGTGLRVPVEGTLGDLGHRHQRFIDRLDDNGVFTPPPSLSRYETVPYRLATDPAQRSVAAFSLLQLDAGGFRAFDTARRALTVAGMTRHATKRAAKRAGWSEAKTRAFVLGHTDDDKGDRVPVGPRRFAYLPLPSIEWRGHGKAPAAGSVRRVMITSFANDCGAEVAWARRALSGQDLISEQDKEPAAMMSLLPSSDKMVRQYTRPATTWATVTPVVLPGYDDPGHYRRRLKSVSDADEQKRLLAHLGERTESLLRKAITQAGFSHVLAAHAELEWRNVGFWPGNDLAERYSVPKHLKRFPCLHVRIKWRDEHDQSLKVAGPICFGGGRFYGLGLFASIGADDTTRSATSPSTTATPPSTPSAPSATPTTTTAATAPPPARGDFWNFDD